MTNNIKIEIKNKGKLLANASVLINSSEYGQINLKSFKIWQSSYVNTRLGQYINIQPPAVRYYPFVFFEDEKQWFKLEKLIWDNYQTKVAENTPIDFDEVNNSTGDQ